MSFDAIDRQFRPKPAPKLECMRCSVTDGVEMESARTQYHWTGAYDDPNNPNADLPLCRVCAKDHHQYWDEMWAEYYSGRL